MELVLIPLLLLGGAAMVYLGSHGSQPTPWATYGPHVSSRGGQRQSLPLDPPAVESPEAQSRSEYSSPAPEPFADLDRLSEIDRRAHVGPSSMAIPSVVLNAPAFGLDVEQVKPRAGDALYAAPAFTPADALIGELMTELAIVRDELRTLQSRMDAIVDFLQPV